MKVIIVEDLPDYQELIVKYLITYLSVKPEVQIYESVLTAEKAIKKQSPDLLLLDIHLKDGTGFELLERLNSDELKFKIIFITAHDNYAIQAFKFSAIDYILKPIDPIEFNNALNKVLEFNKHFEQTKINALKNNIKNDNPLNKLILRDANAIYLVEVNNIIRCESTNNYTTFYLSNKKQIIVSVTLKEYDKMFKDLLFFRATQSHLINLRFFDHYNKNEGGSIVLKDGTPIPLSRGRKELLIEKITHL